MRAWAGRSGLTWAYSTEGGVLAHSVAVLLHFTLRASRRSRVLGTKQADHELMVQDWRWQQNKRSKGSHAAPSLGRPGVVKDNSRTVRHFTSSLTI